MHKQQGFSLIELAIVLVIAGLLLAGVLRGQEWIANAKVKSLAADFRHIPTYFYGYQDRFRVLPGDDHAADTHINGTNASSSNQTQDGLIQGTWNSTTVTDESYLVWQHLRLAGLMNGSTDTTEATKFVPRNSEGGQIGVTGLSSLAGTVTTTTLTGAHAVCSDSIQGRYASQLDTMLDDGAGNTGAMRVVDRATPSAGLATLEPAKAYIVCMSF